MTNFSTSNDQLYWEIRGTGPAVLLVPGTPGDGGQFELLGAALESRRTVITYDRRGTSRSDAGPEWASTSVAEQARDAAAILHAANAGPALVFGTSNGASIALELALREPQLVRAAILHEAPLLSVLADPAPVGEMMGSVISNGMAAGGPSRALEDFLRFAFGDAVVEGWDPELRERVLSNAKMVFEVELPAFQGYRPDEARLSGHRVPIHAAVGDDQPAPFFREAATWLATRLSGEVLTLPGAHGPYFTCPHQLAERLLEVDPL